MSYPRGGFIEVQGSSVAIGVENRDEAAWPRGGRPGSLPGNSVGGPTVREGGVTPGKAERPPSRSGLRRLGRPGGLPPRRSLQAGRDLVQQGLLVGELARLQLRVEQLPVGGQLETAAPRGDQLQIPDLLFERQQQLARQTEGLRLVA